MKFRKRKGLLSGELLLEMSKTVTLESLAVVDGTSTNTVRAFLQHHGVTAYCSDEYKRSLDDLRIHKANAAKRACKGVRYKGLLSEQRILDLAVTELKTYEEIAQLDGTTVDCVASVLRKHGLSAAPKKKTNIEDLSGTSEDRLLEMAKTMTIREISQLTNVKYGTVLMFLKRRGVTAVPQKERRNLLSDDELRELFVRGESDESLAVKNGTSVSSLRERRRGLGIFVQKPQCWYSGSGDFAKSLGISENRLWSIAARIYLGQKCVWCEQQNIDVLQMQHHVLSPSPRKDSRTRDNAALRKQRMDLVIGRNPEQLELLCANCNWLYENFRGRIARITPGLCNAVLQDVALHLLKRPSGCKHRTPQGVVKRRVAELNTTPHAYAKIYALLLSGGACRMCGLSDVRCLQFNHINGDGRKNRWSPSVGKFVRDGLDQQDYLEICGSEVIPDNLEVLCANCNILHEIHERHTRPETTAALIEEIHRWVESSRMLYV